ncbi:MAG: hypothetical protein HY366_03130 [Candidatus Aenigmarchaeota archaeon]|nr:hypothetical protein [Candidatus Aenigmarchaeota archaeon]
MAVIPETAVAHLPPGIGTAYCSVNTSLLDTKICTAQNCTLRVEKYYSNISTRYNIGAVATIYQEKNIAFLEISPQRNSNLTYSFTDKEFALLKDVCAPSIEPVLLYINNKSFGDENCYLKTNKDRLSQPIKLGDWYLDCMHPTSSFFGGPFTSIFVSLMIFALLVMIAIPFLVIYVIIKILKGKHNKKRRKPFWKR